MDPFWKSQVQFAFDVCCYATLPLHTWGDQENAFRFVRGFLEEKYVHPTDEEIIRQQVEYIRKVFEDRCGDT